MADSDDVPLTGSWDVLVVGSGAAGMSTALATIQHGSRSVLIIDKCPPHWAGGNGYFTAGAYRTAHHGLHDLLPLVSNLPKDLESKIDLAKYDEADFMADMRRVTGGRCDEELSTVLVNESRDCIGWLKDYCAVNFQLSFRRQAYEVDGRYKFWGGLALTVREGGKGLIANLNASARRLGVKFAFNTAAQNLLVDEKSGAVVGVRAMRAGQPHEIRAKSVVMCAGGFEASPSLRAQYLGPGWDLAHVRGTPFNTGDMLLAAQRDVQAASKGNWSGCHSVAWDASSDPNSGDRVKTNEFTKSGYPLGLMLNSAGERFVDEGVDMRNYTYAKFGRAILQQPGGIAFQVWDKKTTGWLRDEEYRDEIVPKITAESLEELADQCGERGLEAKQRFVNVIKEYNDAVKAHRAENGNGKFDPTIKDGLGTQSSKTRLTLPKSNWALTIEEPPFLAVKVGSGVTFTFGGLAIDPKTAKVKSAVSGKPIEGLYCAGEMVGGLFFGNYPGGSGLTAGGVFGRRAGKSAAERSRWGEGGWQARL
ncbi:FAD/NAD(P)-binding domain-containing protein [Viridothelium virens]|uniref:FAD/NAD(P)-binding domain-containing protein n=1 Tax=Viridothelium virens TaxID=1048519 RepID=A0A6A6HCI9_VIRVR|nr:FAD/NAD(P)-binding domain-containing protein [Viridothelium virens]